MEMARVENEKCIKNVLNLSLKAKKLPTKIAESL